MARLDDDQVAAALAGLAGWERSGDSLVRELKFANFREAVGFVVRLAFEAEAANHHPDVDIRYNTVRLVLSTHSEGGITSNDVDLARTVQSLAG